MCTCVYLHVYVGSLCTHAGIFSLVFFDDCGDTSDDEHDCGDKEITTVITMMIRRNH